MRTPAWKRARACAAIALCSLVASAPFAARAQTAHAPSATPPAAARTPVAQNVTLSPESVIPDQYVHGQVLTISHGYVVFTTGDALRLRPGTAVPAGTTVGSLVRVTIDQLTRDVKRIELSPRLALEGETDATSLGRQYVVVHSQRNVDTGAVATDTPGPAATVAPTETVTVTFLVAVPANTPLSDDVYVSTERTGFEPAEIRMERVDARHFTTPITLVIGTHLRYQYTRGSNATVERERSGDIAKQRDLVAAPRERVEDAVPRWADLT